MKYRIIAALVIIACMSNIFSQENTDITGQEKDIVYLNINNQSLTLDLYWHKDTKNPTPLVIWIHGGAWRAGNKDNIWEAIQLFPEGFAVASINYRLSQEAIFPAQILDCKAAVRWLRANASRYNINPEKFGVWGGSAGGHLAALVGTSGEKGEWDTIGDYRDVSSRVQAVCDWYGPSDFYRMDDVPGNIDHSAPDSPESQLLGGAIADFPERVKDVNPITWIDKNDPPFLIMHGAMDRTVIPVQSQLLFAALYEKDVKAEFLLLGGLRHGGKDWQEVIPYVKVFFKRELLNQ